MAKDTLAETLRREIERSGKSLSELARASGVDAGRLSRFVRAERDLTFEAAGAVAAALGLGLSTNKRRTPMCNVQIRCRCGDPINGPLAVVVKQRFCSNHPRCRVDYYIEEPVRVKPLLRHVLALVLLAIQKDTDAERQAAMIGAREVIANFEKNNPGVSIDVPRQDWE